jgi:hypothetical protein
MNLSPEKHGAEKMGTTDRNCIPHRIEHQTVATHGGAVGRDAIPGTLRRSAEEPSRQHLRTSQGEGCINAP